MAWSGHRLHRQGFGRLETPVGAIRGETVGANPATSGRATAGGHLFTRSGRRVRCRPLTADQRGSKCAHLDARSAALLSALLSNDLGLIRRGPAGIELLARRWDVVQHSPLSSSRLTSKASCLQGRSIEWGLIADLVETGGTALAAHTASRCGGGSRAAMLRPWSTRWAVWR
jgi:hypothetical protein